RGPARTSDLDGDVNTRREVQLLQLVHSLRRGFNDVDEPLVRALLECFLRLLVRVRRPLNSKALNAGGKRDGPCHAGSGALDRVGYLAGRLVDDAVVKRLEADANSLSSHRKNN